MSTGRVQDPVGNTYDLALIETSNDYRREYTGLHTQFAYRASDRFTLGGNWTWSHLIGDAIDETSGSGSARLTSHSYPEYKQRVWNNPVGDLSTDQRHRVMVYGTYDLVMPKSAGMLTIGLIERVDTGTPYGAVGTGTSSGIDTRSYVTNPGYYSTTSAGRYTTYYYTSRDAYRTETVYNTDLALNYSYKIGGKVEIFVSPQIYNLFNSQHVVAPNSSVTSTSTSLAKFNPFTTAPIECPQGQTGAQCKAMGANWQKGANFGKPTSAGGYQTPRYFQVSAGVRF
jgi:hypothetical protein